jgi:hypothetical protein
MDNSYSAPALATELKFMKTDCISILHLNRKDIQKIVKEESEEKGNYSSAFWPSVCAEIM